MVGPTDLDLRLTVDVTLVPSMLGPSPDWLVGVSGLEVCQANCTWLDRKEVKVR